MSLFVRIFNAFCLLMAFAEALTVPQLCKSKNFGYKIQDPEDCHSFYVCLGNWGQYNLDCGSGYRFNETQQKCIKGKCPPCLMSSLEIKDETTGYTPVAIFISAKDAIEKNYFETNKESLTLKFSLIPIDRFYEQYKEKAENVNNFVFNPSPFPKQVAVNLSIIPEMPNELQSISTNFKEEPMTDETETTIKDLVISISQSPEESTTQQPNTSESTDVPPTESSTEATTLLSIESSNASTPGILTEVTMKSPTESTTSHSYTESSSETSTEKFTTITSEVKTYTTSDWKTECTTQQSGETVTQIQTVPTVQTTRSPVETSTEMTTFSELPSESTTMLPLQSTFQDTTIIATQNAQFPTETTTSEKPFESNAGLPVESTIKPHITVATSVLPIEPTEETTTTTSKELPIETTELTTAPTAIESTSGLTGDYVTQTPVANIPTTTKANPQTTEVATTETTSSITTKTIRQPTTQTTHEATVQSTRVIPTETTTLSTNEPTKNITEQRTDLKIGNDKLKFKSEIEKYPEYRQTRIPFKKIKNSSHNLKPDDCLTLKSGTFIRDRNDCNKYYVCLNGYAVALYCPRGQYFDIDEYVCNFRRLVKNCAV